MKEKSLRLILVTNYLNTQQFDYLSFISKCAQSGVTSVQLRAKGLSDKELVDFGKSLKGILNTLDIPLIVNDRVDVCMELDAAGVHLGQLDGDVERARDLLGNEKMIGLSVNNLFQLERANDLPVDYVGLSALFPTKNKLDVEMIWGISGLQEAVGISVHPIIVIGGVDEHNVHLAIESGARGVAGIGVFHDSIDPVQTTKNLRRIIEKEML